MAEVLPPAHRFQSTLGESLHGMKAESCTATTEARTVQVTRIGLHGRTELRIADALLRQGVETAATAVVEAEQREPTAVQQGAVSYPTGVPERGSQTLGGE